MPGETRTISADADSSPSRRPRIPKRTVIDTVVWVATVASAVGAAYAACQPTGTNGVDQVMRIAVGAIVPLAASRAKRWTWYPLVVVATLFGSGWAQVVALTAVPLLLITASQRRRSRALGAVIGAVTIQSLLRLGDLGLLGASAALTVLAVTGCLLSGYQMAARRTRRRVRRAARVVIGATLVVLAISAVSAFFIQRDLRDAVERSDTALDATSEGETDKAAVDFDRSAQLFRSARDRINTQYMVPSRFVPILAQNLDEVASAADEGATLAGNGQATAVAADYDDLQYESGRFPLERLGTVIGPLSRSTRALTFAEEALQEPRSPWLVKPLDDGLEEFETKVSDARDSAELATTMSFLGPELLGALGPRRYFIAFVTPAELRGSGGFIGSYGELTADDGRLRLTRSGPIRELINAAPAGSRTIDGPPDYVARYGRFSPADFFQDVTFSPDFPATAKVIEQLYPQSGGSPVDGVIQIDPIALAALLEFTGPISVNGLPQLTPDNAAQILLKDQYQVFDQRNSDQEDTLAEATKLTFEKLTTGNLPGPRQISRILGPMVRQGHIKLHSKDDTSVQSVIETIGADGSLRRPADVDVLSIASQNAGNNKIDAFLRREVDLDAEVDENGNYDGKLSVTLHNDAPASGLPNIVIGNNQGDPPGTNRVRLSVYSRHRADAATIEGFPIRPETEREAGLLVHTFVILVPPKGTVVLEISLLGAVASPYELDLIPQPMVNPDRYAVEIDGTDGPLVRRRVGELLRPESLPAP